MRFVLFITDAIILLTFVGVLYLAYESGKERKKGRDKK